MDEHNELERLAGPLLADPPIPRTPVTEIRRRAARRTRQRMAAVGIAAAVVLLAAGTALAMSGRESTGVQVGTGPGTTVNPAYDLTIYMEAHATPAQIAAIQHDLLADPNVTGLLYSTHADSYEHFQCLFSDQPQLIESLQPTDLPDDLQSRHRRRAGRGRSAVRSWLDAAPASRPSCARPASLARTTSTRRRAPYAAQRAGMPSGRDIGAMSYGTSTSMPAVPVDRHHPPLSGSVSRA